MASLLEHHPKLLPALLFTLAMAGQAWLLFRLQARGLPALGKAPVLAVPWEIALALVAVVIAAFPLGGIWFDLVALAGVAAVLVTTGHAPLRHAGLGPDAPIPPLRALGLGLPLALAVFLPLQLLGTAIEALFRHFGLPTPPEPAIALFLQAHDFRTFAAILFTALVAAPLCEEVFFRGFLHSALRGWFPARPAVALCGAAAAFAATHCHWATLLPLFGFGLVQGLVYEASGSLLLCLAVHFWFNAVSALALLAEIASHRVP